MIIIKISKVEGFSSLWLRCYFLCLHMFSIFICLYVYGLICYFLTWIKLYNNDNNTISRTQAIVFNWSYMLVFVCSISEYFPVIRILFVDTMLCILCLVIKTLSRYTLNYSKCLLWNQKQILIFRKANMRIYFQNCLQNNCVNL